MHSESFRLLPWYVKGQLDAERARQMEMHLQGCLACRREAEGLTQLFCAHSQINKPRPVDEARLDALFARIERYEESRRPQPPRPIVAGSLLNRVREVLMRWFFDTRLMLVSGACAAALLAIVIGPMVLSPNAGTQQQVLSSPTQGAELRVKLQFRSATSQADVERIVATTLAERKLQVEYRIEKRSAGEYALVFQQKPDFAALSELLGAWSATPGIASASIDDTAAGR
jgi:anti-sigma factor RsiW